jgi:DNA (cytosine-5)-methyltransferase 1
MLRKISTLDLFAGAGGLAHGAKLAGFSVDTAIEKDHHATQTYAANHSDTRIIHADVRALTLSDLPATKGLRLLMGGPPCQGFSTSNQKTRTRDNPDSQLIREYIRIVKLWKPDCVVFENVRGFENAMDGEFYEYLRSNLDKLKYTVTAKILNSALYGVPQVRNRLFVIAVKDAKYIMPETSSTEITVKEAFSGLPVLENGANISYKKYRSSKTSDYASQLKSHHLKGCENNLVTKNSPTVIKRYNHIPEGGNWENIR